MPQFNAQELGALLKACTMKLSAKYATGTQTGTAFFVAPGLLLTCWHVVKDSKLKGEWEGHMFQPKIRGSDPQGRDLAFLLIDDPPDHPCCILEDGYPNIGERLVSFGYTESYPQGDSGSYECEGVSNHAVDGLLVKVKAGQAFPGMSGGPLVSLVTGRVCAVMATERLNTAMGGARALPIATAYKIWPDLKESQSEDGESRKPWLKILPGSIRADQDSQFTLKDAFEMSIPGGWTFRDTVDAMAQSIDAVVDFHGFSDLELEAPIMSRKISWRSFAEGVSHLRFITVQASAVRPFDVTQHGTLYRLTVQ